MREQDSPSRGGKGSVSLQDSPSRAGRDPYPFLRDSASHRTAQRGARQQGWRRHLGDAHRQATALHVRTAPLAAPCHTVRIAPLAACTASWGPGPVPPARLRGITEEKQGNE